MRLKLINGKTVIRYTFDDVIDVGPKPKKSKCHLSLSLSGSQRSSRTILFILILHILSISSFIVSIAGELEDTWNDAVDEMDILVSDLFYGSHAHRKQRDTSVCQTVAYMNVTNTKYQAYSSIPLALPLVEFHQMLKAVGEFSWNKQNVHIHHQVINNPLITWSVLEPGQSGSCRNDSGDRRTVVESSLRKGCIAAANAGFFNTTTGQCLGNIVSDGVLVQSSGGIQNVHFGLTKDGYIFTGYLSELDLLLQDFKQLVGGVIWLVRDGVNYVAQSMELECADTEETGTLERFATVISSRTAIGHDRQGKIHMIQVDGKTDIYGINLYDLANTLIDLGLYNAINLDGGGSATTVINGTVVNFPSDLCVNSSYNCERRVSTIICAHLPECAVKDCSGHGLCDNAGRCNCRGLWSGLGCEVLSCQDGCSSHGQCTEEGCRCEPGWMGLNCNATCQAGWYGDNCSLPCLCENEAECDIITGTCHCVPGYRGKYCQEECSLGRFGQDCGQGCSCEHSCHCDPKTGSCNETTLSSKYNKAVHCLAVQEIKRLHLVRDKSYQYSLCMTSVICLAAIATASMLLNVILTYLLVRSRHRCKDAKQETKRFAERQRHRWKGARAKMVGRDNDGVDDFKLREFDPTLTNQPEEDSGDEQSLFLAPKKKKNLHKGNF